MAKSGRICGVCTRISPMPTWRVHKFVVRIPGACEGNPRAFLSCLNKNESSLASTDANCAPIGASKIRFPREVSVLPYVMKAVEILFLRGIVCVLDQANHTETKHGPCPFVTKFVLFTNVLQTGQCP